MYIPLLPFTVLVFYATWGFVDFVDSLVLAAWRRDRP